MGLNCGKAVPIPFSTDNSHIVKSSPSPQSLAGTQAQNKRLVNLFRDVFEIPISVIIFLKLPQLLYTELTGGGGGCCCGGGGGVQQLLST